MEYDTSDKTHGTLIKHDSVWRNHINPEFGERKLSEITLLQLQGFVNSKYASGAYKHSYVESMLKLLYFLYGVAYRNELIDPYRYDIMFRDKGRLHMPEMSQVEAEEDEVVVFEKYEIEKINYILIVGKADCYIPFLVGYLCGLRISEVFGLTWDCVDWENMAFTFKKQLVYQDNVWCLCPVKTLASSRQVEFPVMLNNLPFDYKQYNEGQKKKLGYGYKDNEIVLDKLQNKNGVPIKSGDFIFRKSDGTLMTPNAFKYWTSILADNKIKFKFHYLRHTHLTQMADAGVNAYTVMSRAGHLNFNTTLNYYINKDSISRNFLIKRLNEIEIDEPNNTFKVTLSDKDYLYSETEVENINKKMKKKIPRKR